MPFFLKRSLLDERKALPGSDLNGFLSDAQLQSVPVVSYAPVPAALTKAPGCARCPCYGENLRSHPAACLMPAGSVWYLNTQTV